METTTKLTDKNGVEIQVGQECEAYNDETGVYFNGEVVGIKDDYVSVEDMNGDVFDIEPYDVEVELDLREIAEQEGFDIIETTTGTNGYPQNLKFAIVGFENFEDAQHLANKYGLNVESFRKRDGWQLWNRDNANMYSPYKLDVHRDFGDNYNEVDADVIIEGIKDNIDNLEYKDVADYLKEQSNILEEINRAEENEVVVTYMGEYYDTLPVESMSFSHDTWNYIIGVI